MKKLIAYILAAFAALALLSGCMEETVPEEVEQRYIGYIEAAKTDYYVAVNEYGHFEDLFIKADAESSGLYVQDYEILGWEKLSDELWVVTCIISDAINPDGFECHHFVGLIDGEYYVMTSSMHMPDELKEGINVEAYDYTGEDVVDPEDIIR